MPLEPDQFQFSESLKSELMSLIQDLAIVIKRTDNLKSMASRHDIIIPITVHDEQLCDDEDGFCLGPHKEKFESSGDPLTSEDDFDAPAVVDKPKPVTTSPRISHNSVFKKIGSVFLIVCLILL